MADLQEGIQRYILLIFVLSASEVVSAEQPCGSLAFPTEFDSTVLHQPEHTQVVIPFEESEEGCTDEPDDTGNKIVVEKKIFDGVFTNLCTILLVNGSCSTDSTGDADCVCLEEKGKYEFRKNVTREDTDLTLAFASSKGAKTKLITFDITYPAVITELELNSRGPDEEPVPLEQNKSLDVACRWENGNPPVTARLLNRHGNTVDDSVKSEDIQHTFPRVSCQDAGLIRCEAPGASQNKTATLLVKCSPDLTDPNMKTLSTEAGQSADVMFRVRTHTTRFKACSVTRKMAFVYTSSSAERDFSCSRLTGTPPDLTLTVSMNHIRKQDAGRWRLQLTNEAGTGQLDFLLAVTEKSVSGDEQVTIRYHTNAGEDNVGQDSSRGDGGCDGLVVIVVIVLVIVDAGVVVCVIVCRRRRDGRHGRNSPSEQVQLNIETAARTDEEPPPPVCGPLASRRRQNAEDRGTSHPLNDVVVPRASAQSNRGNLPGDYLQPMPAASEAYERPVQPAYAPPRPLYQSLGHVYTGMN